MTEPARQRNDSVATAAARPVAAAAVERRRDFPMLAPRADGSRLVYLDNAATTQKPAQVIERITRFYAGENSNGPATAALYADARARIALAIGAAPHELMFAQSTTSAIDLVAQRWGGRHVGTGDEIVVTGLEHNANLAPWRELAHARGAILHIAQVESDGDLRAAAVARLLSPRTKLVALAHVSNVLGTRLPVAEIAAAAHRVGARVLVDGAQAIAHLAVDVRALDADFYAFSAHKAFGPTGIGALYIRSDQIEELRCRDGASDRAGQTPSAEGCSAPTAGCLEAGTPDIAGALGMAAALEYMQSIGMDAIAAHERDLLAYAQERLARVNGLRLIGTAPDKVAIQSFTLDGREPEDVRARLARAGVEVQAGQFSARPLLGYLGVDAAVRVSIALYNTRADIDALVDALAANEDARR